VVHCLKKDIHHRGTEDSEMGSRILIRMKRVLLALSVIFAAASAYADSADLQLVINADPVYRVTIIPGRPSS